MTLGEVLRRAAGYLTGKGVEDARLDAELLLGHALELTRVELYTQYDRELNASELAAFRGLVARRGRREPVAYILGRWGFRHLTLRVDQRALIPRPETEVLVERCLDRIKDVDAPRVLDIGVGSGAIALSIASEHRGARVTAVDNSPDALELARENAELIGVEIELRRAGFEAAENGWDLVVSNPPYVSVAEYGSLQPEIRDWEPREALVGEGLHEQVARSVRSAWLVLEVGDGQAGDVAEMLAGLGYEEVKISQDLADRDRIVEGRRP